MRSNQSSSRQGYRSEKSKSEISKTPHTAIHLPNSKLTEENTDSVSKYEKMLKKVNEEFDNSLKKNSELSSQISDLEMKLHKTTEELNKAQQFIDVQNKVKREKSLEEDGKQDLINLNNELKNIVQDKNDEIERLKRVQVDLENKLLSDNMSVYSGYNEQELRNKFDHLVIKYEQLEARIKEKESEIYHLNSVIQRQNVSTYSMTFIG